MGTNGLEAVQSFLNLNQPRTTPQEPRTLGQGQPPGAGQRDSVALEGGDRAQNIAEAFEAAIYRSQTQRVEMSGSYRQGQVLLGQGDGGAEEASLSAQQLEFSFVAESRVEQLAQFSRRTQAVADGLEGPRRSSYAQVSQQVAARFEFSVSISATALNGFAGTSEGLQDNQALFDKFLEFGKQILEAADEALNKFLSELDMGFLNPAQGGEQKSFEDAITEIFNGMFDGSFMNGLFGAGQALPGQPALDNAQGPNGEGPNGGGIPARQGQAYAGVQQLEFNFSFSAEISVSQEVVQESDPIVLDLDDDGFELTNYQQGARFDIEASGSLTSRTAFVNGGDAFLALDRNNDGVINDGSELFGDQRGAANGFEELRKLDDNGDGRINRLDAAFDALRLFKDNGNGKTEAGELLSLKEAGIEELSLDYRNVNERAAGGNRFEQLASFKRSDGTFGRSGDAILNFIA